MAVQQTARVLALPKGSCTRPERQVLAVLTDCARPDGSHVFPSHQFIAARAHYSLRWTRIVLQRLIARGWLIVERGGSGRSRARYRLAIPTLDALANPEPANQLRSFPQTFPQVVHRGDQSIPSERIDRSPQRGSIDPLREDRSIPQAPDPSARAVNALACGQPSDPSLYPSLYPSREPSLYGGAPSLPLEDDDAALRARVLEETRLRLRRVGVLPLARPAS